MQEILNGWCSASLFHRPHLPAASPDAYEEAHAHHLSARYADIAAGGKEIHKLLLASNRLLKVCPHLSLLYASHAFPPVSRLASRSATRHPTLVACSPHLSCTWLSHVRYLREPPHGVRTLIS